MTVEIDASALRMHPASAWDSCLASTATTMRCALCTDPVNVTHAPAQDAPECAPAVRPAHEDPRSSFDHLNEHVLLQLWNRATAVRQEAKRRHP